MTPKELGQLFIKNFPPNGDGWTRPILMSELVKLNPEFQTTNGCQWARSNVSWLGKQFIISREKRSNRIYSVQLCGYNNKPVNHSIPGFVYSQIGKRCAVLDISTNIEIDHKDASYQKTDLSLSDFQPLSKAVNDAKRQHCKECQASNCRFDAKRLGSCISYIYGTQSFADSGCKGCYWFDPQAFWREATKNAQNN